MRISEADRAVQVAVAGHLDEAQTGMLFMIWTEATILRTALHYFCAESERESAGLIEVDGVEIHLGVRAY